MEEKEKVEYINNKCPNCGSDLAFLAGTKKLKCESCGSEFDIESLGMGRLDYEEKDYLAALDDLRINPRVEKAKIIRCKDCGANFDIKDKTVSTKCPYCGSLKTIVEDKDDILGIDGVVPFVITKEQVNDLFKNWIKNKIFAPSAMKKASSSTFEGYYIPLYTFDSKTKSSYTARRGDYYYTTRTIHTKEGTRTEQVREIRWTNVSGNYNISFDDLLVRATNNNFNKFVDRIKDYNLEVMESYQEKFLLGYYAERASISLSEGFSLAKASMDSIIASNIKIQIGGDEVDDLRVNTNFSNITYKNIMVPIYCGTFEYNKKQYRFLVNGQNGKFNGTYPKSATKITLFVLSIVVILAVIIILSMKYGN